MSTGSSDDVLQRLQQLEDLLQSERQRNQRLEEELRYVKQDAHLGSDTSLERQSGAGHTAASGDWSSDQRAPSQRPWRKILYEKMPYEDNYVPDSFLEELVTNAYVRKPDVRAYFVNTAAITQQISAVAMFLVMFMYSADGALPVALMIAVDLLLMLAGYVVLAVVEPPGQPRTGLAFSGTLPSFCLFLACLRITAPVLRTLTVSYADDSIYALAITLSALHLAVHDYSYANSATSNFQGTLSLNAAMFATVLLASRLNSNELVFGFILFAVELFAFFPMARHQVKRHSLLLHLAITVALVTAASGLLALRDKTLFFVYLCTVVFVTLGCPLWLLGIQQYKNHIQGPWDIAHIETNGAT